VVVVMVRGSGLVLQSIRREQVSVEVQQ